MTVKEKYSELPQDTLEQLEFIRKYFGTEAEFVVAEDDNFALSASIDENNNPIIKSSDPDSVEIVDVIHEIWHLYIKAKLRINNYNVSDEIEEIMIEKSGSPKQFQHLFFYLHSAVEHFFFLKNINSKLEPYRFIEQTLNAVLENKKRDYLKWEVQQLAIDVVQLKILFSDTNKGRKELKHIKEICPKAFDLGHVLFDHLKEFDCVEKEPEIMESMIKVLWDINEDMVREKEKRQIVFKYK